MKRYSLSPLRAEILCSLLLLMGGWAFFSLLYPYHFVEQEQEYIFQLTPRFLEQYLIQPGGISGWIGDFLMQFSLFPPAGGTILTLLSLAIWLLVRALLKPFLAESRWWGISLLPLLLLWMVHCDYLARFSGTVAYLISLGGLFLYTRISNTGLRHFAALPLLTLLYWVCGGPFLGAALAFGLFEIFFADKTIPSKPQAHSRRVLAGLLCLCTMLLLPLVTRRFLLTLSWKAAFFGEYIYETALEFPIFLFLLWGFLPAIFLLHLLFAKNRTALPHLSLLQLFLLIGLGYATLSTHANLFREHIFALTHFSQQKKWDKVISYYDQHKTRSKMSTVLVNLALANQGNLLQSMFFYPQYGEWGLVPDWTEDFWTPAVLHKVVAQIALANGSIGMHRANGFMSNVYGVRGLQPAVLQDQIRTEILNGSYQVASKMLIPLENALFYRKWAGEMRALLNRPEVIPTTPWVRQMEKLRYTETPFDDTQEFAARRIFELDSLPRNRVAFEYFMADMMLTRKIVPLIEHLPLLQKFGYTHIPIHLQEALLAYSTLPIAKQEVLNAYPISKAVGANYQLYMRNYSQFQNRPDFPKIMAQSFGNTYWYYMHFIVPALEKYIHNTPYPQR